MPVSSIGVNGRMASVWSRSSDHDGIGPSVVGHFVRDTIARSPEEEAIRRELAEEVERAMAPIE
jgi:hypothetical protein